MPQININSDLLVAQPLPDGTVSWTLASRLGDMLDMAEKLFGGRDTSYTLLGIQFQSKDPEFGIVENIVSISLSNLTCGLLQTCREACYQMAQETVHLLAPTGDRNANNLEEGVSCYFADYYMMDRRNSKSLNGAQCLPKNYERALALVKPRLDDDIDCVRRIRENQPSFQDMTKEDISAEFPNLESEDVDFLISKFDRDSGS